jgi:hypothetical protein
MSHLAACLAPRPLWLVNPVDGRRRPVSVESAQRAGRFAETVYAMHQDSGKLSRARFDDVKLISDRVVEWLKTSNQ